MPRPVNFLSDIEVDEISLVDRPANQHAKVAIAKNAPEEAPVPYFDDKGQVVDPDSLELGAVVYDEAGNGFVVSDEDDEPNHEVEENSHDQELEPVGKSLAEQVREDLSKAFSDVERDAVISKAMGEISKAEQRAARAEEIAKAERTLRLEREYISKAAEYGIGGVTPEELGPVLMRAAETLPYDDCVVLHKALTAGGEAFEELGFTGAAENSLDPFSIVDSLMANDVSKAADGSSRDAAIAKAFEANPSAYEEYRLGQMSR